MRRYTQLFIFMLASLGLSSMAAAVITPTGGGSGGGGSISTPIGPPPPVPPMNPTLVTPDPLEAGATSSSSNLPDTAPNNVAWFKFTLDEASTVDILSSASPDGAIQVDTVLGLFPVAANDPAGALIESAVDCSVGYQFHGCLLGLMLDPAMYLVGVFEYNFAQMGATDFMDGWLPNGPTAAGSNTMHITINVTPKNGTTPEPGILALYGLGLAGLGFTARRRSRKQS